MSNAGSTFLPGSNLTNLIVLHGEHVSGAVFLARLWPSACAAVAVTATGLVAIFWRTLGAAPAQRAPAVAARVGVGLVAVGAAAALVLVLASPALPVLAVGVAAVVLARIDVRQVRRAVDVRVLAGLFVLAVALGALGRAWSTPGDAVASFGRWQTALAGAAASVVVNNLPAAVLLAPSPPQHARALLLGLNLGPNLAVTGSLSALLWLRVSRGLGCRPSVRTYSTLGLVLMPAALAASVAAASV
jgi:arsenical pump membrane protein